MKYFYPQLYRVKANYLEKTEKIEEAISELKKSESLAKDLGFIPNLINTKLKLAEIYKNLNDLSTFEQKQKESESLIETLIESIKDPEIKNRFKNMTTPLLNT
jgi:tetratricopeptide (TPR) repeat protein